SSVLMYIQCRTPHVIFSFSCYYSYFFFFQAEDGIRDATVTGVQTCALPISSKRMFVYLETTKSDIRFDAGHLHMLVIIAAIAATVLENARHLQRLERENQWLRDEVNLQHAMVGESPRMHEIYQFVAKVAASDSTILLLGESGTGKELVARAIHQSSPRNRQPFVAINC